jgi:sugar phosphate isomerase/epimerase
MPLESLAAKASEWGYDGLELACWGDHFDVRKAVADRSYCEERLDLLQRHGLGVWAISNHLVGQAVCDVIDDRHRSILPARVWGDGDPAGVRKRAVDEMIATARAAKALGVPVVNGFTGSGIWHLLYSFPPVSPEAINAGYDAFSELWMPILQAFEEAGVRFALEVHPTEIAFDVVTAERALEALEHHRAFGFNYDPSHLGYQGVDYLDFLDRFADRIYHVHAKDVWWSDRPGVSGVFGGHLGFGDQRRGWDFRSLGRGRIDFEEIMRRLNRIGYTGPLSVEWEDSGMDREYGAREARDFLRRLEFEPPDAAFDAAFERPEA